MNDTVGEERVEKYLSMAREALEEASPSSGDKAEDLRALASSYVEDAEHWYDEGDLVLAYVALNFAHGLLDAGVRAEVFDAYNPELFTQASRE